MDQNNKKTIVLVDDHAIVRDGLSELIGKIGPYRVIADFGDGETFLNAVPAKVKPDLVILDLGLPGMSGVEVMSVLSERDASIPVLVLTLNEDERGIISVFRNGARGYLLKNCGAATLSRAIEDIFNTGYYHNEFLSMSLKGSSQASDQDKIIERLSPREREFLRLVCDEKEYTYEQIADIMGVQHRTVDGYRESLFEKFGIKSKTGLVLFVLRNRLFDYLNV